MSRTEIYRCDICGDESTKAREWEKGVEVQASWGNHSGVRRHYVRGIDICPKCVERIETEFDAAWDRVKEANGGWK